LAGRFLAALLSVKGTSAVERCRTVFAEVLMRPRAGRIYDDTPGFLENA